MEPKIFIKNMICISLLFHGWQQISLVLKMELNAIKEFKKFQIMHLLFTAFGLILEMGQSFKNFVMVLMI